ncbi:MAG: leucyl aminopeptidase family protein [Deltaproteobacteria bacterium]|nr:leucyl aminopeptidase family protein [Deltaproteobacteria bacterium]
MKSIIQNNVGKWELKEKNFSIELEKFLKNAEPSKTKGWVFVLSDTPSSIKDNAKKTNELIENYSLPWQKESLLKSSQDNYYFQTQFGPFWILRHRSGKMNFEQFGSDSKYSWARETVGNLMAHFKAHKLSDIYFYFGDKNNDFFLGSLVGMDLNHYHFKNVNQEKKESVPRIWISSFDRELMKEAFHRSTAINLCRHFVNLPPNELGPESFVKEVKNLGINKSLKMQIWDQAKLQKENMNLHLAVGQGASQKPQLLKLSYSQPKNKKTIAFVGKGITFDTGGLDIKPSSAMRLMKKDMGGAACVLGLAHYISQKQWNFNFEFYIPLAENSVDGKSFRPSDVVQSRSGLRVEIDNTDAEGRLVLADSLDLATKENKELEFVIDVATLTGAIKVALGAEVAGLFTNDEGLAKKLSHASQTSGDWCWRMPLIDKYFSSLNSHFADFKNSAEGFGGAITAALFLQKFVNGKKWAHLDIYGWNDKPTGCLAFSGGNGQGVQLLIDFVNSQELG